jgi:hypothetical protein
MGSVGRRDYVAFGSNRGNEMIAPLAYAVLLLAGGSVVWGLLTAAVNRPPGKAQLLYAAFVELAVLVQTVVAVAYLIGGFRPVEMATTVGYLLGIVVLIPAAWLWANTERTRFSGVVLAVAAMAVLGMTLRLLILWAPA